MIQGHELIQLVEALMAPLELASGEPVAATSLSFSVVASLKILRNPLNAFMSAFLRRKIDTLNRL